VAASFTISRQGAAIFLPARRNFAQFAVFVYFPNLLANGGNSMSDLIRVVVIDDHLVSRKGIISLLADNPKIAVVAEGSAGNHVLELLDQYKPDVLITDLQMPAQADDPKGVLFEPISTIKRALQKHETLSVIVLSQEQDIQTIQGLAEIGVKGYLLKTDDYARSLGQTVEMIHVGTMYFSPEVRDIILSAPRLRRKAILTKQQLSILRVVVRSPGASREEQARSLDISVSTLHKHTNKMFAAMEVPNMIACVLKAIRLGLVDL
jgi:DNA-binding NarL/FixJ family response regulator